LRYFARRPALALFGPHYHTCAIYSS